MATNEVDGVVVKIEADDGGLKKQLDTSKKEIENFGKESSNSVDSIGNSAKDSGTDIKKNLGKTATSPTENNLKSFGAAGAAAIALIGGAAVSAASDLVGLGNAISGGLGDSQLSDEVRALAIAMATTLPFAMEDIVNVLLPLAKALDLTTEEMEMLASAVLFAAAKMGVDAVSLVDDLIDVMRKLNLEVDDALKLLDVMGAFSEVSKNFDATGFLKSLSDSSEALKLLNDEYLENTIILMGILMDTMGDASFIVDILNKSFDEAKLTGQDLNDVLERYMILIRGAADGSIPMEEAAAKLGVSMTELSQVINAINGEWDKFDDALSNSAGNIADTAERLNPLNGQLQLFKNQLKIITGILGLVFVPLLIGINHLMSLFLNLITDGEGNLNAFGKAIIFVGSAWILWKAIRPLITSIAKQTRKLATATKVTGDVAVVSGAKQTTALKKTEVAANRTSKAVGKLGKAFKAVGSLGAIGFLIKGISGGIGSSGNSSSGGNVSSQSGAGAGTFSVQGNSGTINNTVNLQSQTTLDGRVIAETVNAINTEDSYFSENILDGIE